MKQGKVIAESVFNATRLVLSFRHLILLVVFSPLLVAQEPIADPAVQRVEEEVAKRRRLLENFNDARGVVYRPAQIPDEWYSRESEYGISDAALFSCGQTIANITRKEVLISGKVVQKRVNLTQRVTTAKKLVPELLRAVERADVAIISIGAKILCLVDPADI